MKAATALAIVAFAQIGFSVPTAQIQGATVKRAAPEPPGYDYPFVADKRAASTLVQRAAPEPPGYDYPFVADKN
ncbi:hypothetical protein V500_05193 [Pseudogymnoascus sp. VKM F-4518 (FW-2643)]|nr:hypothetical protein V500_05193 [Pseudogymnoascus sp. VKM F-4518 (FW-2643)]